MKKISTIEVFGNEIFKEQKLTIGMDLGDRWSFYCVLDEAGKIILEQKVATTPEAMKQTFGKIPRSLIALETGTHSPWVSRLLTDLDSSPRPETPTKIKKDCDIAKSGNEQNPRLLDRQTEYRFERNPCDAKDCDYRDSYNRHCFRGARGQRTFT